eukprot:1303970-Rhodomonas_salina.1
MAPPSLRACASSSAVESSLAWTDLALALLVEHPRAPTPLVSSEGGQSHRQEGTSTLSTCGQRQQHSGPHVSRRHSA